MTKQTFYHEYCHTLQCKYKDIKHDIELCLEDKQKEKKETGQISNEQEYKNAYNRFLHIRAIEETEADLFGSICIILETKQNNSPFHF